MDNPNYTTEHRKGQHLLNEERYEIEVRLKDGWSIYKIAKHLGRAYNTIKDEVERGTVTLYNGKVKRYKADQTWLRLFFMICVNTENGIKYRMVIGLVSRKASYRP